MKKKKQIIDTLKKAIWVMIAISFCLVITEKVDSSRIMITVTFITLLVREIYKGIVWRCPGCNEYLGNYTDVKYCDKCGRDIYR